MEINVIARINERTYQTKVMAMFFMNLTNKENVHVVAVNMKLRIYINTQTKITWDDLISV